MIVAAQRPGDACQCCVVLLDERPGPVSSREHCGRHACLIRLPLMGRYRWMPEHPAVNATALDFFRFPEEELAARRSLGREKRVCVIGAGIAGLVAAYELRKAGHTVVLLEAQETIGGRIRTWHVGSLSGEFGPMRIPLRHEGTMHYVRELGLKDKEGKFFQHNVDGWLLLRDQKERIANWLSFIPAFGGDPRYLFPGYPFNKIASDPEQLLSKVLE
jgi:hypothetical protein